ncbi:MAG TPA: TaqI-like C-terminal specificity domain-containing protein [Lutibacter sp.]
MSIFQSSVVTKHLKTQKKEKIAIQWELFKNHFHNPTIQDNIRNSKEEQYQGEFLIDLFVNVLGYTKNPTPNFNITTEYKNVKDSKKADGAIVVNDVVKAVIELKGTNTTDLGKIEVQAFGYKNNQPECTYVITSNFEKLRFYIDNAIEHIEFNLFTLTEKDFELLYLCLAFENIQNDTPKNIKKESISQEDAITKKLYNDYSLFKRELHQSLVILNPQFDALTLFQKSQKLLDRFLFLFFAEDRQLLPPNSVRLILNQWKQLKELDAYSPLFDRFKKYFGYLNTGFKGKQYDVYAYNGGLFLPDEVLDNIIIDDDLLYLHTLKLSEYDFISEVDVNILGHIFENSLNELDEIKAQLEGQTVDKSKTKRKKDGVFYTPKYITKYIVENTVGKLCEEKKAELNIIEDDYITDKKRQQKTKKILDDRIAKYRKWLLELTICDPACGSGAFLNQALDYLITEHKYLDELQAKLLGHTIIMSDVEKGILENNLFGVDLNEESVEIAKLSLWLRTAQPNRKLNDLNNNIKCGNSLIDDPEIAGEKAFNWQKEFPQIFAKGGFDVVIGNPPYVQLSKITSTTENEKKYLLDRYSTSGGRLNTYIFFIHLINEISKQNGLSSYIIPNTILTQEYYSDTRLLILTKLNLYKIVNYPIMPFADAVVDSVSLFMRRNDNINEIQILEQTNFKTTLIKNTLKKDFINNYKNNFEVNGDIITIKIDNANYKILGDLLEINQAIALKGDKSLSVKPNHQEGYLKLIDGKHINRYRINWGGDYLEYNVDKIHSCKRRDIFESNEKLFFRRVSSTLIFTYDNQQYFALNTLIVLNLKANITISLKALLAVLNSKLLNHFYVNKYKSTKKVFSEIQASTVKLLPIPNISTQDQFNFISKTDLLLVSNKELQELSQKFQRALEREFALDSLPKKLQDWYLLSYGEFVKELEKKKVKLSLSQKAEWEDYFLQESKKALALKTNIDNTDKEIDQMVYELYGLTKEEIEIVEKN